MFPALNELGEAHWLRRATKRVPFALSSVRFSCCSEAAHDHWNLEESHENAPRCRRLCSGFLFRPDRGSCERQHRWAGRQGGFCFHSGKWPGSRWGLYWVPFQELPRVALCVPVVS